jgi:hypothetical protein
MHRFRHTIQLVTIMVCFAWGGLQFTSDVLAQPTDSTALLAASDKQTETEYPGLPSGVAHAVRSIVATQQVINSTTGEAEIASGVIVNDQQILTAGHAVSHDGRIACSNTSVVSPGLLTNASASSDSATHVSARYNDSDDVAVVTVQSSDNFKSLPNISIAETKLKKGDTVYFINYQPTNDGKLRSPNSKGYDKPVVFSGTVVDADSGRVTIATGGGKSYGSGTAVDNLVRRGASGGAIVNAQGELVGLSVASESLAANRTATSIMTDYRVALPVSTNYQLAYMQPVTQGLLGELQSTAVSCTAN